MHPPADSTLTDHDRHQIHHLLWIAVEAIDARWSPPDGFAGESAYAFAAACEDGSEVDPRAPNVSSDNTPSPEKKP